MMYSQFPSAVLAFVVFNLVFVSGFWRLQCKGITAVAQIDPLMDPGVPSAHQHTIKGSGGLTTTSEASDLLANKCTSCEVSQDHSAYWTPSLYFAATDGSMSIVPEVSDHLTYYKYVPATAGGSYKNPIAIPTGFKMISGNPYLRNFTLPVPDPPLPWSGKDATQEALAQKAVGFNCLDYSNKPEGSLFRHFLPDKAYLDANCRDGLRLELLFPICWDGKNLDTPDHKSHVAYSDAGLNGGNCPSGFDTVINQLFFETIFDTASFAHKSGFFTLSMGDPTGYGYHGDAIIAWEAGVLEAATAKCGPVDTPFGASGTSSDCPLFNIVSDADMASCKLNVPANEAGDKLLQGGSLKALPGNNPIQYGPQQAIKGGGVAHPAPAASAPVAPAVSAAQAQGIVLAQQPSTSSAAPAPPSPAPAPPAPAPPAPASPAPVVTPAPAPPAANPLDANSLPIVSTRYWTSDRVAYEEIIVVETMTVIGNAPAAETPAAAAKRHVHAGQHRHAHHRRGGLAQNAG